MLIVEDSVSDTELLVRELDRCLDAFEWERVDSMDALEQALGTSPDIVMCDVFFPKMDGRAAIATIRARLPDVALIAVTGELDDRDAAELMVVGADDYLLKDRLGRLGGAIERILTTRRQQRRAHGLIHGQNEILTGVAMGVPLAETLEAIVRLAEANTDDALCSIEILDGDIIRHGAAPSLPDEWNRMVDGQMIGPTAGSCGTAAYRGEPVIVTDIATDPLWADYKDQALALGLRACWSRPAFATSREVLGTFAMYYPTTRAPTAEDEQLAEVALGLTAVALEKARSDTDARLAERVLDSMVEGLMVFSPTLQVVDVNAAFERILGRRLEEVRGTFPDFLDEQGETPELAAEIRTALADEGTWQGEVRWRRKDGESFPALASFGAVRDEYGAVSHYVGVFADVSASQDYEQRLAFLARHDVLTQLPNREDFQHSLAAVLASASKHGHCVGVVFIDLDNFKDINESLGHDAGDLLLQSLAARMRDVVRDADALARFGGDEFGIVLGEVDGADDCSAFMQRLIEALAVPVLIDGHELYVTLSAGISLYPQDGSSGTELMSNADSALYRAKEEGRNSYQFFSREMNAEALENLLLANSLRTALERGELSLHYQPRYDITSGQVTAVEALLRWNHPERGMVPPDRFIPVAENAGLIVPIGEWVLEEACRQAVAWRGQGHEDLRVAVNLSARQLALPDLVQRVRTILDATGLPPSALDIEITESMLMVDTVRAIEIVAALHGMGIGIAIDDFGTGYSSLSYLKKFTIDDLKIDRTFIADLPEDEDDAAIVRAIIAVAHSLGMHTVAEGVETEAQLAFLRDVGCDEIQGYLFSRPLPPETLDLSTRRG